MFDVLKKPLKRGVAAAGLATSLLATPASASADGPELFADGGIFAGYAWGEGGGFLFGLEGRVGGDWTDEFACGAEPALASAATARLSLLNFRRPALHLGGQIGMVAGRIGSVFDFSFGYRWGNGGGWSAPMGMDLQVSYANTFVRYDPLLESTAVGGGLRFPDIDGQFSCVVAGRALHDAEGHAPLPAVRALGEERLAEDVEPEVAREIAAGWGRRAQAEWASVPAFLQLAQQLRIAGAPATLVRRAVLAAEDELHHAVMTAKASMAFGGAPLRLGRVTPQTRAPAYGVAGLHRLAAESWIDGCLGEGRAAAAAHLEARAATAPVLAEVQRTIARDEASHAALAWDVLAWTVDVGGDGVRDVLHAVRDARPEGLQDERDMDRDLSGFGLLPAVAHERALDAMHPSAVARLDATLA